MLSELRHRRPPLRSSKFRVRYGACSKVCSTFQPKTVVCTIRSCLRTGAAGPWIVIRWKSDLAIFFETARIPSVAQTRGKHCRTVPKSRVCARVSVCLRVFPVGAISNRENSTRLTMFHPFDNRITQWEPGRGRNSAFRHALRAPRSTRRGVCRTATVVLLQYTYFAACAGPFRGRAVLAQSGIQVYTRCCHSRNHSTRTHSDTRDDCRRPLSGSKPPQKHSFGPPTAHALVHV